MLNGNRSLIFLGEADFLFDYLTINPNLDASLDSAALARDRIFRDSGARLDLRLKPADAIRDLLRQLAPSDERPVVLMLHRHLGKALALFPDAPVVHMLRDPRDVAKSSIGMGWAGDVFHGVGHWIDTENEWDRVIAARPAIRAHELRYEAVIRDTQGQLKDLCRFLGIDFDDAMLAYHRGSSYAAPDVALIEQWRRGQTPVEIALVEGRTGGLLARRGYRASGITPIVPRGGRLLVLWLRNKAAIWRYQLRHFGAIDPLLVALSRNLGVARLGAGAQARIDHKVRRLLK